MFKSRPKGGPEETRGAAPSWSPGRTQVESFMKDQEPRGSLGAAHEYSRRSSKQLRSSPGGAQAFA